MSTNLTESYRLNAVDGAAREAQSEDLDNSLPPVDRGKDAWLCLASCFILEALVWGFPFAFGVFQDYYSTHEAFAGDISAISAIGTTATGIMYFSAPFMYEFLRIYPSMRKPCMVVGFCILLSSLIGASFAQTIPQLLATQGVLYAIGGSIHYFPAFLYLEEWFVSRRGLAYGTVWAGTGASGIVIPLTMEWVIRNYSFRTALRTWAVASVVLTTPVLFFMKGRLPIETLRNRPQNINLAFFRSSAFWILQTGNIVQSLGYFLPSLYLPSFARSIGLSPFAGTLAVSLCNASTMIGATVTGHLVDRYHVTTAINFCTIGTVAAVFLLWSFAINQTVLYIFAILYGVFAGGFAATWSGCSNPIRRNFPAVETGMIVSMFAAGKGIGAVISGPLSGSLLKANPWHGSIHTEFAYASGYGTLILFSGLTAACQSIGWGAKKFGII